MLNKIVAVQECDPSSLRSSGQAARKHHSSNLPAGRQVQFDT